MIRLWKVEFSRTIEFHSADREWPEKETNDSFSVSKGGRVIYITLRTQERCLYYLHGPSSTAERPKGQDPDETLKLCLWYDWSRRIKMFLRYWAITKFQSNHLCSIRRKKAHIHSLLKIKWKWVWWTFTR